MPYYQMPYQEKKSDRMSFLLMALMSY